MHGRLTDEIIRQRADSEPFVVGITGMDASGKTSVANLLEEELKEAGIPVQVIHVDDFHHARADRYREGVTEATKYYKQSFDFDRIVKELLEPIRNHGIFQVALTCLDVESDTWTIERNFSVDEGSVVLIEGVFLFRPELAHFIDLMVFLRVDESVVIDRALLRDVSANAAEILRKYQTKYLPAQRDYLADFPSERNADIIIDNNDWENPLIIKWPR